MYPRDSASSVVTLEGCGRTGGVLPQLVSPDDDNAAADGLRHEIERLQNAVEHLERSNCELQEALKLGPDPDYTSAVEENIAVISKYRTNIVNMQLVFSRTSQTASGHPASAPDSMASTFQPSLQSQTMKAGSERQQDVTGGPEIGLEDFNSKT